MIATWNRFVGWIGEEEGATSLALFRIGIGLSVLYTVGDMVRLGLVDVLWIDEAFGGMSALGSGAWLVRWFGGPSPTVVWSFVGVSLLSGLAMTVGFGGRLTALLALLTTTNLGDLNGMAGGSYDELLANGLWLVLLGGGFRTLSVDAWLARRAIWPVVPVVAIVRWLAVWQLVLMYASTGLQKVSAYWVPGGESSALYYILQQPSWHRIDMAWVAWVFPLTQLSTTVTWFWEVLSPLWILALVLDRPRPDGRPRTDALRDRLLALRFPFAPGYIRAALALLTGTLAWLVARIGWVRWTFFGVGVAMHVLIHLTMHVGPFGVVSLAYYSVMVHPEEWQRLLRRLGLRQGSSRSEAPWALRSNSDVTGRRPPPSEFGTVQV